MAFLRSLLFGAGLMPLIRQAMACTSTDVIKGGSSSYASYWSMSAGPNLVTFPTISTGGPDGGAYLEIDDFSYSYVIVRQNIASVEVGTQYRVSLDWSIATNNSTGASCTLSVAVEGSSFTAASAAIVAGRSSGWGTVTGFYTPTSSTGIPFVISIGCSQGVSDGNPIIGLADISMIRSCTGTTSVTNDASSYTTFTPSATDSRSSAASTISSNGSLGLLTNALSTMTASTPTVLSTASSSSTATWSTSSGGEAVTKEDGTTLTADTTSGITLEASQSVDSSDASSVSGMVAVGSIPKRKRSGVSCTLSIYQGRNLLDGITISTGSSAPFSICLDGSSSGSFALTIKVVCDGTGAVVQISGLVVDTSVAAAEECAAAAATTTSAITSSSAPALQRSSAVTPGSSSPVLTRVPIRSLNPSSRVSSSGALIVTPASPSITPSLRPDFGSSSDSGFSGTFGLSVPSGPDSGSKAGFSGSSAFPGSVVNISGFKTHSSARFSTSISGSSGTDISGSNPGAFTTSTVSHTEVHTVTACPSTVKTCPASAKTTYVTTETVIDYTTICPATATQTPTPATAVRVVGASEVEGYTTSTVYKMFVHAVTACPTSVKDCPASKQTTFLTTETIVDYTTICPITATGTGFAATRTASPLSRFTEYATRTVYTTSVHTVTACPSIVKDCPASAKSTFVTTETMPAYVTTYTVLPTEPSHANVASADEEIYSTSTIYETAVHTMRLVPTGSSDHTATQGSISVYTSLVPVGTIIYSSAKSAGSTTTVSVAGSTGANKPEDVNAVYAGQSTTDTAFIALTPSTGAPPSSLISSARASSVATISAVTISSAGAESVSSTKTAAGAVFTGAASSVASSSVFVWAIGRLLAVFL